MSARRTYLDHNATAPLRPEARAAMLAALDLTGNASSVHAEGRAAREIVEKARADVAALVDASSDEIVFTSGATEANNWAIRGGWDFLAVSRIEHESVLAPARAAGVELLEFPSDPNGAADLDLLATKLSGADGSPSSRLISLQMANPETGVVQPVAGAATLARELGAVSHSDAVQAAGRIHVSFRELGLDLMSISAHKLGGPKGVGALVVREGVRPAPLMLGGGQEGRRRAGTENIAAIAGFGAAARAALRDLSDTVRVEGLRDRMENDLLRIAPSVQILGGNCARLPNTTCMALPGLPSTTALIRLDLAGVAVSAGSACSSGKIGSSHVLEAMGAGDQLAAAAIRVSLGTTTTEADIDRFLEVWAEIARDVRVSKANHHPPARDGSRTFGELRAGE